MRNRKYIEDFSYDADKDFIELTLAHEFSDKSNGVFHPHETKQAQMGSSKKLVNVAFVDTNDNSQDSPKTGKEKYIKSFKKAGRKSKYTSYYSSYRGSYDDEMELDIVKVVDKILEEKKILIMDMKKLWRKYISLLKIDHLALFEFMEEKYYVHYSRAVKMRTI